MQRFLDRFADVAPAPAEAEAGPAETEGVVDAAATLAERPVRANALSAASLGPITTRADALLLMDLVRAYYERYEPSSPLPFLIDRARRLADKDFMDILRDLAPDGLSQAQHIAGNRE